MDGAGRRGLSIALNQLWGGSACKRLSTPGVSSWEDRYSRISQYEFNSFQDRARFMIYLSYKSIFPFKIHGKDS